MPAPRALVEPRHVKVRRPVRRLPADVDAVHAPPPVAAHMIAMDVNNPARPITRFFTSTARPNGAWSRAGLAWAHDSLFVQTADGVWNPQEGCGARRCCAWRRRR